MPVTMTGRVKSWVKRTGYGFIADLSDPDALQGKQQDVFFSVEDLEDKLKDLEKHELCGKTVSFVLQHDFADRAQARDVREAVMGSKKFDPKSFEKESRGLMVACAPLAPEDPEYPTHNRIAFLIHRRCVKHLAGNDFKLLRKLRRDSGVNYHFYTDEHTPKVLELWSEKRKTVSSSAYEVRDFLITKAKEEAVEILASLNKSEEDVPEPRYRVAITLSCPSAAIGPIIGHRCQVQLALANRASLDRFEISGEDSNGERIVKLVGMPFSTALGRCMVQERMRYRGIETDIESGHRDQAQNALDEELMFQTYKACWTEYFSQKALVDYATTLSNYMAAAANAKKT